MMMMMIMMKMLLTLRLELFCRLKLLEVCDDDSGDDDEIR
jgi:hypothetical protein